MPKNIMGSEFSDARFQRRITQHIITKSLQGMCSAPNVLKGQCDSYLDSVHINSHFASSY